MNKRIMKVTTLFSIVGLLSGCLSELDKEDIDYLISIEHKIHNKDLLHKLIWSEYL